jgi:hypothetical protein
MGIVSWPNTDIPKKNKQSTKMKVFTMVRIEVEKVIFIFERRKKI